MGFTSGFAGGVALTSSILYLSISVHRQNRVRQASLLAQQNQVLTNIVDPQPPSPPPTARQVRGGFVDQAKDKWNSEIEGVARRIYDTDWNQVRADWEDRIWSVAAKPLKEAKDKIVEATPPLNRREG